MFTGLYPHQHGILDNFHRLSPSAVTLAELLQQSGFRSGAFVSSSTMTGGPSGLQRGFEVWDDKLESHRRSAGLTVDRALRWLDSLEATDRFFLFVHLYDAHGPYAPPEEYASLFLSESPGPPVEIVPAYQIQFVEEQQIDFDLNHYVNRYDGAIRYLDDQLGRLLDAVDLDRTAVLVVADHGETLGERYWSLDHGGQVFDEQIRIPLVLYLPGAKPQWLANPVETVDLLPTLLEAMAVSNSRGSDVAGRSLMPEMANGARLAKRPVFSSAIALSQRHADRGYELDRNRLILGVRYEGWKLVRYPGQQEDYWELYDLEADPDERVNLVDQQVERLEELKRLLEDWNRLATIVEPDPIELSEEDKEKLRVLGYLD